jgi:transglutaminase-like putative cysteine protease
MQQFLAPSPIIDFDHPEVRLLSESLQRSAGRAEYIEGCFTWVRDRVAHAADVDSDVISCSASEVLTSRVGLCYAKSHLLAALLRSGGVPAGFCYQRLSTGQDGRFCLHGLVSVFHPGKGWYRIDPRGGTRGAAARYAPPHETLVYVPTVPGERDLEGVYGEPLSVVLRALRHYKSMAVLMQHLPDLP